MHRCLFLGELAVANQFFHEAVVHGHSLQGVVPEEVRARVPDMGDGQGGAVGPRSRERRAHARKRRVAGCLVPNRSVGAADRIADGNPRIDRGLQSFERSRTGDLTGAMASHTVGDGEEFQAPVNEIGIFVSFAHLTGIGRRAADDLHRTSSMTVSPNCTRSPRRRRVGSVTASPLRVVPLVEPRSST